MISVFLLLFIVQLKRLITLNPPSSLLATHLRETETLQAALHSDYIYLLYYYYTVLISLILKIILWEKTLCFPESGLMRLNPLLILP